MAHRPMDKNSTSYAQEETSTSVHVQEEMESIPIVQPIPQPLSTDPPAADTSSKLTVEQVQKVVDCLREKRIPDKEIQQLINRLVPFAKSLPGSNLFFKNEQKKLQSIIGSPVYKDSPWKWFVTMSNVDIYEEYIYRILYSDENGASDDSY